MSIKAQINFRNSIIVIEYVKLKVQKNKYDIAESRGFWNRVVLTFERARGRSRDRKVKKESEYLRVWYNGSENVSLVRVHAKR